MTAARVLTIDEWNDLLGQINDLATEPPAGCNALSEVSLVSAPHIWKASDITAARDKLTEICSNNLFTTPIDGKWLEEIITELEAAIENGWCGCAACSPIIEYPKDISLENEGCSWDWEWSTQCGLFVAGCYVPLNVYQLVDGQSLYPAVSDPWGMLFDICRYWVLETTDGSPDPHPYACYDPPSPPLRYPPYPVVTKGMGLIDNWGVAHAPTGYGYHYASLIQTKYAYAYLDPPHPIPYTSCDPSMVLSARCVRSTLPTTFAAHTPGAVVGTFGLTPDDYWHAIDDVYGSGQIGGGFKMDFETGLVYLDPNSGYDYEPGNQAWVTINIRRGDWGGVYVDGIINLILTAV